MGLLTDPTERDSSAFRRICELSAAATDVPLTSFALEMDRRMFPENILTIVACEVQMADFNGREVPNE